MSCSRWSARSTARRRRSAGCIRPRWRRRSGSCRSAAGGSWPRRSRTSGSPTCWRRCRRTSRSDSSRSSTMNASPACSTRWRPTTPPTCSVRCRRRCAPQLLDAMDPDEAEPVRRLLTYEPDTAGGLMTPEPIILAATSTVAQALARVRDPDLPVPLAAQVFVCQPPLETPTGRFIGVVGVQRLLREAPSKPVGRCIDEEWEPVRVRRERPRGRQAARRLRRRRDPRHRRGRPARRRGDDRRRPRPDPAGRLAHRPGAGVMHGTTRQPQQATRRPRRLRL